MRSSDHVAARAFARTPTDNDGCSRNSLTSPERALVFSIVKFPISAVSGG